MHGCSSGSALLVNAEVDSMGGVVDGRVGIGLETSPHRVAIEKAQAELRQEYDVREERRRELVFLEKGGNPLDFKFGNAASVSVLSTSLTDQNPEHLITSEPKGSSALAASPHGDSVESIGKQGACIACEPNSADNLTFFDGDNDLLEGERKSLRFTRRISIAPSEQSSQVDGTHNAKEPEDSAVVRPYARRKRFKISRESARSNSFDIAQTRGIQGSSLPIRGGPRDTKGMKSETINQKEMTISSASNMKSKKSNGDMVLEVASDKQLDMDLDGAQELEMKAEPTNGTLPEILLDVVAPKRSLHIKQCQLDPLLVPIDAVSAKPDVIEKQQLLLGSQERLSCAATTNTENEITSFQMDGFSNFKRMSKNMLNEAHNSSAAVGLKGLDSKSSCTQTSLVLDVHNDIDMGPITRDVDSNGNTLEGTLEVEGIPKPGDDQTVQEQAGKLIDGGVVINKYHSCHNSSTVKEVEDINPKRSELHDEDKPHSDAEVVQQSDHYLSDTGRKTDVVDDNSSNKKENICTNKLQDPQDISIGEEAVTYAKDLIEVPDPLSSSGNGMKVVKHEDSILEEARTIEVKRKRIAELSVCSLPLENQRKSHWELVLEEMAWMANDFAQERLWKIAAASQVCRRVAFDSWLRFEQQYHGQKLREKAHTMAKAVIQFWHSAELNLNGGDPKACSDKCEHPLVSSTRVDKNDAYKRNSDRSNMEPGKELECQHPRKNLALAMQDYAIRYLKYNSSLRCPLQAEAPATPDRISDFGIIENSWDDNLTEESLFYTVPSGAMEVYRKSIETHVIQNEKTGNSVHEEVEISYDALAEDAYIEDEGETSAYYLSGSFVSSKSSKSTHKKRKNFTKSYTPQSYEAGGDLSYGHCNTATQQAMLIGKRPGSTNVGLIPTKRIRTASRQRVLSPFSAAATGSIQVQMKTDDSSGDTSSLQDDQSTLHGGSQFHKSMEVESVGDFNRQLPYDSLETSTKPKKKKKAKHMGSTYDQGWQLDSALLNEQREISRKRMESHHFESNSTSGLYSQHGGKKPKILKQPFENTCDNMTTVTGSIPSPVASKNNMPNTNKILKLFGGRDRGRKAKSSKNPVGQPGSGNPWSLFEDQALVVLVHDLGPNWDLISDAINSTLHFKCIFRKSTECKERHKILMDKSAGDGGDSAEDSGSSQPYPSTLPGIPKGSARQLFQRLQEPMEEDTLKSHFEKIIKIGQKQHYHRSQENQDPKQIVQIHNSHIIALSQVCPNNLSGGVLTPLDLCDTTASSPDVLSLGYQGSHASDIATSNQGAVTSLLPSPGANSSLQGSSSMVLGGNLSSPSAAHNATVRDVRYSVPRTSSASVDDQQRMHQYNQILSSRGIQQSTLPSGVSGTDRGVRVLPSGSGMGMMCGMNRNMPISRPGFQGMASSPMLNSGSMLSSSMVGMANPVNMHSGAGSSQGNSTIRPHEALHMMRSVHNLEHQRQIMVPELQMQVTQGNNQGITPYNGTSAAFSTQTTTPPIQSYQGHPQQQHQVSPQQSHALVSPHHTHVQGPNHTSGSKQQAYAIQLAKDRQLPQQYMQQQQQQQFAVSNAMMSHLQPQPHVPMPSTLQNSSQIQHQASSQPVSLSPLSPSSAMTPILVQHQQKNHLPPHGLNQNPGSSGLTNQIAKQRQRQPQQQQLQQASRYHPQHRQHPQPQQQAKLMKGVVGRGFVHQNLPMDHSHLNGLSVPPGSRPLEKGEQIMHLMQGQSVYSGSGLSQIPQSKPSFSQSPSHSQLQQKLHTGPVPSKQCQFPSHSGHSPDGQVPTALSNHTLSTTNQAVPTTVVASNHKHVQPHSQMHQKQVNQTQPNAHGIPQQNRQVNSELPNRSQSDVAQADQHPLNSTSQVGVSMSVSQSSFDSANLLLGSPAVAAPWKSSEPAYGSSTPNSTNQSSSVGSPSLSNSAGSETIPPISQGLVPMQLSGNLPSHGHRVGTQWQQQELPPKQSLTQASQSQEQPPDHKSPQHNLALQQ